MFLHLALKAWEWPGDEANKIYGSSFTINFFLISEIFTLAEPKSHQYQLFRKAFLDQQDCIFLPQLGWRDVLSSVALLISAEYHSTQGCV